MNVLIMVIGVGFGSSAADATTGFLTVVSRPWAHVFVDGEKLAGTTPIQRHTLPVGRHTVRLESPSAGKFRERVVEIRVGQTVRLIVDFDKE